MVTPRETYDLEIALYDPNGPVAIIAFLLFGAIAVWYWIRFFRSGRARPRYTLPIVIGCTTTSLGYICRFSRRNHINAWSWLFETIFILCSPCAFLAQIYVLLPRLVAHLDQTEEFPLNPKFVRIFFILADVATVLTQLAGTALMITFGDLVKIGRILVTAGLWVQLVCFLAFFGIYVKIWQRIRHTLPSDSWRDLSSPRTLFYSLALCCGFMLVRSIYRVAEYTAGAESSLGHSEPAFYLLDTVPMLLFAMTFAVVWPPKVLEVAAIRPSYNLPVLSSRPYSK